MSEALTDVELLDAFETQVRRSIDNGHGWTHERVGALVRSTAPSWSAFGGGVFLTELGSLTSAEVDAAIADEVAFFTGLGKPWEWKHYAHDRPADLPSRLVAAGLVPEEEEALVLGEVEVVLAACSDATVPSEVELRELAGGDHAGLAALLEAEWGDGESVLRDLLAEQAAAPGRMPIHVAAVGDEIVSAGWVRFHESTQFASLWGGSTAPQWRRRGIYRALVARRAEQARARGLRFLQVDASPDSRPILERLGLRVVSTTTPYAGP